MDIRSPERKLCCRKFFSFFKTGFAFEVKAVYVDVFGYGSVLLWCVFYLANPEKLLVLTDRRVRKKKHELTNRRVKEYYTGACRQQEGMTITCVVCLLLLDIC